jgi:glycosyltransferase involved in cell wall biosynthesis
MAPRSSPAQILEVTSYPPPRSGWGIRVEFVKKRLEREGHQCVVVNTGTSRLIPSPEYETVTGARDFVEKVWRFSRRGFLVHSHANGDAIKGVLLALAAQAINLLHGHRCVLTFHAGVIQRFFPKQRGPLVVPLYWVLFQIPRTIICNSEAVKQCIIGYGVRPSKVAVVPAFCRDYLEYSPTDLPAELEAFFGRYPSILFSYLRMRPLFYPLTLIEGLRRLVDQGHDVGLVVCGGLSHSEEGLWREVQDAIAANSLNDRVCFIDDLDHDAFLTALRRSALYLRTPITDGVASSVLESLALRVPVVACDNGTRPPGVITYKATDAGDMASAVGAVLSHRDQVVSSLQSVDLPDTLSDEVTILTA